MDWLLRLLIYVSSLTFSLNTFVLKGACLFPHILIEHLLCVSPSDEGIHSPVHLCSLPLGLAARTPCNKVNAHAFRVPSIVTTGPLTPLLLTSPTGALVGSTLIFLFADFIIFAPVLAFSPFSLSKVPLNSSNSLVVVYATVALSDSAHAPEVGFSVLFIFVTDDNLSYSAGSTQIDVN